MRTRILSVLCLISTFVMSFGQRHELGLQIGATNLVGDIGRTNYVLQKPMSLTHISEFGVPFYFGALYRMNFNPYQTLRFNLGYVNIQFNDQLAQENYRNQRHNYGANSLYMAEALFEYNFLPINNEQKTPMFSPYLFAGIGGMMYSTTQHTLDYGNTPMVDASGDFVPPTDTPDIKKKMNNSLTVAVPFGVGLKYKFNYNWTIFGEFTFRPTFSDNLDYSHLSEKQVKIIYDKEAVAAIRGAKKYLTKDEINQLITPYLEANRVGNLQSKDWANSITLGISYSFGRPPCYCD
ncbi:DUF6089 family protein [Riemerella columbina]|uniref:type IX secretion system protein PorG n=1 Tax=Riemerella columbina TaxID=103810 RepID=UPI0026709B11|nr:DUF6089 family protein [Riemerella columbina]WKS95468.1 DUF6089 family protein [Riemerella columbina]